MGILVQTSKEFEQSKNPNWEDLVGTPTRWAMWSGNKIKVIPGLTTASTFTLGYIQMPVLFTSSTVSVYDLVVGRSYEIADSGTGTTWSDVGSDGSSVGTQFVATATGATGTGTVYEVVDMRIPPSHQEFLKYKAAYFLLNMRGERQFIDLADKFSTEFDKLVGE